MRAALRGTRIKRQREEADYRDAFPGDLTKAARDAILEARTILDLIESL